MAVDAFTISWVPFYFYAFPPISTILKVLKILQENSCDKSMLISSVIRFKISCNANNYSNRETNGIHKKTNLIAGILYGSHSHAETFHS